MNYCINISGWGWALKLKFVSDVHVGASQRIFTNCIVNTTIYGGFAQPAKSTYEVLSWLTPSYAGGKPYRRQMTKGALSWATLLEIVYQKPQRVKTSNRVTRGKSFWHRHRQQRKRLLAEALMTGIHRMCSRMVVNRKYYLRGTGGKREKQTMSGTRGEKKGLQKRGRAGARVYEPKRWQS